MKKSLRELCMAMAIYFCATGNLLATDNQFNTDHTMDKNLNLTKEWDKVFPQSDKVSHSKVTHPSMRMGNCLLSLLAVRSVP